MTIRPRRGNVAIGTTLIEVIVALVLLGMVGLAGVELTRTAGDAIRLVGTSEDTMRHADNFLNAVSLWSRTELDQRLGERAQGPWRQEIQRATPTLYLVTLRDSAGSGIVLSTALFREEMRNASR